jgi:hypothetical protein
MGPGTSSIGITDWGCTRRGITVRSKIGREVNASGVFGEIQRFEFCPRDVAGIKSGRIVAGSIESEITSLSFLLGILCGDF